MPTALIRITQDVTVGNPGEALEGVAGTAVTFANSDDLDVASWYYEVLDTPPGSLVPVQAQGPSSSLSTLTITPDVPGSYRVRLTVVGNDSTRDVDIRVFSVPFAGLGIIAPPFQRSPRQLPLTGPGAKPDEMNFEGQALGWMGTLVKKLLHYALKMLSEEDWSFTWYFNPAPVEFSAAPDNVENDTADFNIGTSGAPEGIHIGNDRRQALSFILTFGDSATFGATATILIFKLPAHSPGYHYEIDPARMAQNSIAPGLFLAKAEVGVTSYVGRTIIGYALDETHIAFSLKEIATIVTDAGGVYPAMSFGDLLFIDTGPLPVLVVADPPEA